MYLIRIFKPSLCSLIFQDLNAFSQTIFPYYARIPSKYLKHITFRGGHSAHFYIIQHFTHTPAFTHPRTHAHTKQSQNIYIVIFGHKIV